MSGLEKYHLTEEVLANMKIGQSLSNVCCHMPGSISEVHRVPGGWIYVFTLVTGGGTQLHTQFVKTSTHPMT